MQMKARAEKSFFFYDANVLKHVAHFDTDKTSSRLQHDTLIVFQQCCFVLNPPGRSRGPHKIN